MESSTCLFGVLYVCFVFGVFCGLVEELVYNIDLGFFSISSYNLKLESFQVAPQLLDVFFFVLIFPYSSLVWSNYPIFKTDIFCLLGSF